MKKYLLLASTALLFSTNAWAGEITDAGHSATVNAKVTLTDATIIDYVSDMDFGTLVLGSSFASETAVARVRSDGGGTATLDILSEDIVSHSGTPAVGVVASNEGYLVINEITCADGTATTAGCTLAEGVTIKDITYPTGGCSGCDIGATLYLQGIYQGSYNVLDVPALKVHVAY